MSLSHKGLQARIIVGGEELPIHKQSLEDDQTMLGYIASVAGKPFTVVMDHLEGDDGYRCELAIDGQRAGSLVLNNHHCSTYKSGVRTGLRSERPFKFSSIRLQGTV